jgi:flagellar motor switch protein FliG
MVDTKTLSIALKGASEAVEGNILDNLSSRVREMVAEEREIAGPMPMSDVQDARNEIMISIRALIEAGDFRPTRGADDLVA